MRYTPAFTAFENRRAHFSLLSCALASSLLMLAACGSGGGGSSDADSPSAVSDAQRVQAATATAESTTNACMVIRADNFYWEIGDANTAKASGSVGGTKYVANSVMPIASATKWLYLSYVAQRRAGAGLTAADIKFLNFQSGYTSFASCDPGDTVASCVASGNNGNYTAAHLDKFAYDGGHMQKHASLNGVGDMNLGAMNNAALATELRLLLDSGFAVEFFQPQLAGGARTTAQDYALVLRKMLSGSLRMGALLGTSPVCTNPDTCPQAIRTPVPNTESWHYSIGHWVEDDPVLGDGAFSSAGAFGFYPWIDASKKYYGVVARLGLPGTGVDSVNCGRLIRKAWLSGVTQ